MSGGNTKKQLMIMQDFGSTVLTCTPSYSLFLAEAAAEEGVDIRKLKLRVGIFGAEPWSERMRDEIEAKVGIKAIDIYGLSEILGPGVGIECIEAQSGLHIWEDHFIPEIIDPGDLRGPAGRRAGRTGDHHDHQGGHPADPLPHPRHHPRSSPNPASAAAPTGAWRA